MQENDTQCQVEKRTIEEWAARKETKRWLLCLAATAAGWLPEQEDDAQDEVTEEEYDAAVEAARTAYERYEAESAPVHGQVGKRTVRAICHPTYYVGAIVKILSPTEANTLSRELGKASNKSDAECARLLADHFKSVVLWPEWKHLERVRQRMVKAIEVVLPLRWLQSLGSDGGERVKKR